MRKKTIILEYGFDGQWKEKDNPVGISEIETVAQLLIHGRKDYPKGKKVGMRLEVKLKD